MDDPNSDRPDLGQYVFEQIELEMHEQDKRYWQELREMQIPTIAKVAIALRQGPSPPPRPVQLRTIIHRYAQSLFYVEASKYPPLSPQFLPWLFSLAERCGKRVIRNVKELEAHSFGGSLDYHSVTEAQIQETVDEAGRASINTFLGDQAKRDPGLPNGLQPSKPEHREEKAPPVAKPVNEQLRELMDECRLTAEALAEAIGIDERNVYRHLKGGSGLRKSTIAAYEKLFSEKLGRRIQLNVSKTSLPPPIERQ